MISMSQTYSIRQMRKNGESISEIARKTGVSRNTVLAAYEQLRVEVGPVLIACGQNHRVAGKPRRFAGGAVGFTDLDGDPVELSVVGGEPDQGA